MPGRELLDDALVQSRNSLPLISATTRLHIARVLTAFDQAEARDVFLRAIDDLNQMPLSLHEAEAIWHEAHLLAAATDPLLLGNLPPLSSQRNLQIRSQLVQVMISHGHIQAALDYTTTIEPDERFPHQVMSMVLNNCPNEETKRSLLRRSIEAWQNSLPSSGKSNPTIRLWFLHAFARNWTLLPAAEVLSITYRLVEVVLSETDLPMQARLGPGAQVTFTSVRQYTLFRLLDPLRYLNPALADSLIENHGELAAAAAILPWGMREEREAHERQPAASRAMPASGGFGFGVGDSKADIVFCPPLPDGVSPGQFDNVFEKALSTLLQDAGSNGAVKEFWPSTQSLRTLFYTAGTAFGTDAIRYLERIPDRDLRLCAQVELAAGLAGLPEYRGLRMTSPLRALV
jgi:hypothetical protein